MPSNRDTPSAVKSSHKVNPGLAQERQENSEAGWEEGVQLFNLGPAATAVAVLPPVEAPGQPNSRGRAPEGVGKACWGCGHRPDVHAGSGPQGSCGPCLDLQFFGQKTEPVSPLTRLCGEGLRGEGGCLRGWAPRGRGGNVRPPLLCAPGVQALQPERAWEFL